MYDAKNSMLGITLLFVLLGCGKDPGIELQRVRSPDKRVDAVIMRRNGGATVAFSFEVFITLPNKKATGEPLIHMTSVRGGPSVIWNRSRYLEVRYSRALVLQFTNYWADAALDNYHYEVELALRPATPGDSLR